MVSNKKKDMRIRRKINRFFNNKIWIKKNISLIVSILVIFIVMLVGIVPQKVDVKIGQPAPRDIRAPRDIEDEITTQKLKLEAMESVNTIYNIDTSIQIQTKTDVRMYFRLLRELKEDNNRSYEEKVELLEEQKYVELDRLLHESLLGISLEQDMLLEDAVYETINQVMGPGLTKEEVDKSKEMAETIFNSIGGLDSEMQVAGTQIIDSKIVANKFPEAKSTEREKEKAAEAVEPVIIKEGELIVAENSNINRSIYSILEKSGLIATDYKGYLKLAAGCLTLTLVIVTILRAYLLSFEKQVLNDKKKISVIMAISVMMIFISKGLSGLSVYLMPVAATSILISIIANERIAIVVSIVVAIFAGIASSIDMNTLFMLLIGGIVGSFACRNVQQRSNVIIIGLIVALTNSVIIIGFGLAEDIEFNIIIKQLAYGIANGVLSSLIAIGTLPVWENYFGVLTPLKLLEIMNPNNPLLRRLLLEAPGTYYHSMLLGNLAERAADEIGANSLLVRVASYYHDVGKLKRPYFFKENQSDMQNPHDSISPSLSKTIITSHTTDGVELAKENKIPKEISDIMVQHHGTTLVAYFYHKAKEKDPDISEDEYRYDGVKPQSKEAAIIMIADSVEAASRSITMPTEDKLQKLVKNIIKSKLDDSQLDESGLTLKDLKSIEKSFVKTISGIYHDRIVYPDIN